MTALLAFWAGASLGVIVGNFLPVNLFRDLFARLAARLSKGKQ